MKSATAYYLLLLYATVVLKPLVPQLTDAWEHSFNKAIHLATVHAHFGNHHLDHELADKTADKEPAGHEKNTKTEDSFSPHVSVFTDPGMYKTRLISPTLGWMPNRKTFTIYLSILTPPPKW